MSEPPVEKSCRHGTPGEGIDNIIVTEKDLLRERTYGPRIKQGPDVVILDRGHNTTCAVNLLGATVVSWRFRNQEQLFISRETMLNGLKSVRGGVTFVFPHYGLWAFGPQHGFARIMRWDVEKAPEMNKDGDIEAIFSIEDNEFSHSMWNFQFKIFYHITLLEKELHFDLEVKNTSKFFPFTFKLILHTHFKVPDVRNIEIIGLQDTQFIDKTLDYEYFPEEFEEYREAVTIEEWTDRLYQFTQDELFINNAMSGRQMRIRKDNFPDIVVWNPWTRLSRELADFNKNEYKYMICIEPGQVSNEVHLCPGDSFKASQYLKVV